MNVVVLGGGNGGSISIRALKQFSDVSLSAVIAMSDSGYSSGRLRKEFGGLPPGDIVRAVLAMSKYDYETLRAVFYDYRFDDVGKMSNHSLGGLFVSLTEKYNGGIVDSIRALAQAVQVVGPVYPVTTDISDLCVELSNGEVVVGEHENDEPTYSRELRIKKAWLQPTPTIYERAKQAIVDADVLVIGPGSFYCSIIATLLPAGMMEAIAESKAKLLFIPGHAYKLHGETGPMVLSDFVKELQKYLPRKIDAVLYNTATLNDAQKRYYAEKEWGIIGADPENIPDYRIVGGDYEHDNGGLDPVKLGNILHEVIE